MAKPVEEFKDRLALALSINNMKPIELSEKMDIAKSTISQYMSGRMTPKTDRLYLMAEKLGVSPEWLAGFDAPMHGLDLRIVDTDDVIEIVDNSENLEIAKLYSQLPTDKKKLVKDLIQSLL